MHLAAGFHHKRKQDWWLPENVHIQYNASIDQSLYTRPEKNCMLTKFIAYGKVKFQL
jgi:hypothetical protein